MSLINQMLQDLEKRQPEGGTVELPPGVTPAATREAGTRWGKIAVLVAVVALAVIGIRQLPDKQSSVNSPKVEVATLAAPVAQMPAEVIPSPQAAVVEEPPAAVDTKTVTEMPAAEPSKKKETRKERRKREREERAARKAATPPAQVTSSVGTESGRIQRTDSQASTAQADVLYQQSVEAFASGRSAESIEKLKQALAIEGGHAAARQLLAKQLLEQRRLEEVRSVLREGASRQPAQLQWSTLLARLELERGDVSAARQAIDLGLPQAAGSADFQSLAGAVAQRQAKPDEAAEFYRRALQLKPADGRSWVGLGLALEAEGHRPEAREAFRRALSTENLSPDLEALAQRKSR